MVIDQSRLLRIVLVGAALFGWLTAAVAIFAIHWAAPAAVGTAVAASVLSLVCLHLLRRDLVRRASWVAVVGLAVVVLAAAFFTGGNRAPAQLAFFVVIAIASLLLGRRAGLAIAGVGMVSAVIFGWARLGGVLPAAEVTVPLAHMLTLLITAPMLAYLIGTAVQRMSDALAAAHRNQAALEESLQRNEQQRAQLERRVRQQATVARLAELALSGNNFQDLLAEATADLRELLRVDASVVAELLPAKHTFQERASSGWEGPTDLSAGAGAESILDYAVLHGRGVFSNDLPHERRFTPVPEVLARGFQSCLAAPIHGPGHPWGAVAVVSRTSGYFSDDDVHFVELVGNLLGVVIERERTSGALLKSEQQLRQAYKMEALGRLAGGVAHDFNNLMTVVLTFSGLLLDAQSDPAAKDDLLAIREAAQRAASLTQQLLTFSRRTPRRPRVLDPNEVVADTLKMLARVLGEDVELVTRLDPAVGFVEADPSQLEQVVLNLVMNAREAMPNGGRLELATRRLETEPALPGGPLMELSVTDSGVGIAPEVLPNIFEPFFTTKTRGTGLGLATVYGAVTQSGGEVRVDSAPGRTCFRVLLPSCAAPTEAVRAPLKSVGQVGNNRRVLVVEDEPPVRRVVTRVLTRAGFRVSEAVDALDALEQLAQGQLPDLVLSDVVMPRMSGADLAKQVASRYPQVRFMLMSGHTADLLDEAAQLELVRKPFSAEELVAAVDRRLSRPVLTVT